uniref:Putative GT4: distantly related to 1, 2-diacylglycerol-3-glucosyltransferase n=1 Tax=Magnetococcus massalia (strain MO-1) TaxID=451514 RepID=A0A1S7LNP3_MAGMO|nr:Putative GT4 : distantly related to 1, 2-diacylglycerol-3-glucosyltransferase [Candidatus Magnetococcus massalia]
MSHLHEKELVLFFTQGLSLKAWDELGMLDRETALYRALVPHMKGITFVTYGGAEELAYQAKLPGIRIVYNRWKLHPWRYGRWLELSCHLPRHPWRRGNVIFKTNQTPGGGLPLRIAQRWNIPLIARCGYLYSDFTYDKQGIDSMASVRATHLEHTLFHGASETVVTTEAMRQTIIRRYGVAQELINLIPNYVDCQEFAPYPVESQPRLKRILCIARLDPSKNIMALLKALVGMPGVHLDLVGQGPLKEKVTQFIADKELCVTMIDRVPHQELPAMMNRADLFVLPSHYEGHPKVLLEAMACGRAVLGSDVPGIAPVIDHRHSGWLCDTDTASLAEAIHLLLEHPRLRQDLGQAARKQMLEQVALDRIMELEMQLYGKL